MNWTVGPGDDRPRFQLPLRSPRSREPRHLSQAGMPALALVAGMAALVCIHLER